MAKTRRNTRKAERKSRKSSRKTQSGGKRRMSEWNKSVKRVYEEMKRKDSNTTFRMALKEASKRKRNGSL
jgi:hypothetical protein